MINSRIVQLLFLVSSMTAQMVGMMPKEEVSKRPTEETRNMMPQMKKMGENLGMLLPELKHKIFSSALKLKLNPEYEVYKKLDVGSEVRGIALNSDNTRALIGLKNGVALIYDVEKGTVIKELKNHKGPIQSVALNTDGTIGLTGSLDNTVGIWDMNRGELLRTLQEDSPVFSVALSADGALALIGGLDKIARLYNTSTGELLKELSVGFVIFSVALSADGSIALICSDDRTARVWDTSTGKSIKTLQEGIPLTSVALSADGSIAVTVTIDKKVWVWDVKTGTLLNKLLYDGDAIMSVALSKDGKKVLLGTRDNTIQVWYTQPLPEKKETSTPLRVLHTTGKVMAVAFGGADFIASGLDNNTALIWKPAEFVTLK